MSACMCVSHCPVWLIITFNHCLLRLLLRNSLVLGVKNIKFKLRYYFCQRLCFYPCLFACLSVCLSACYEWIFMEFCGDVECYCWNQFSKGRKIHKAFLIRSGVQRNFAYTFVLVFLQIYFLRFFN